VALAEVIRMGKPEMRGLRALVTILSEVPKTSEANVEAMLAMRLLKSTSTVPVIVYAPVVEMEPAKETTPKNPKSDEPVSAAVKVASPTLAVIPIVPATVNEESENE
jgi:hypothetical protein